VLAGGALVIGAAGFNELLGWRNNGDMWLTKALHRVKCVVRWGLITLNRPRALNALSLGMVRDADGHLACVASR
jgi:enoyl-CoA hydratase/carnithine racemase